MKKVFALLAVALLAAAAFGVVLRNGVPVNGDSYTCTIKGVAFEMVFVEGGKDKDGVDVSDFWIGKFEVTQQQWWAVYGSWPDGYAPSAAYGAGDSYPMYNVSWNDAKAFIDSLNVAVGGGKFRLPAEREWEYAARGGSAQEAYAYAGSDSLNLVGWYGDHPNGGNMCHPVGKLAPNGVGAYDMSGNVWEHCEDWWGDWWDVNAMPPKPPDTGYDSLHVRRCGGWRNGAEACVVSRRSNTPPDNRSNDFGFRVACSSQ